MPAGWAILAETRRRVSKDNPVATALWLLGSVAFTIYVSKIGNYDKVYGSLGAVVILLLWFYWSAYIILLGAELNAEIDRHAAPKVP